MVDSKDEPEAKALFDELGVSVVSGQRFFDGFVDEQDSADEYVEQKVQLWMRCVQKLTKAAESQPQAAHAALTKSLQFEWAYMQRVIANCADAFAPLHDAIKFLPTLVGGNISEWLFSLPARMGGLGVRDPVKSAQMAYSASKEGMAKITMLSKEMRSFPCRTTVKRSQSHIPNSTRSRRSFMRVSLMQS